MEAEAIHSAALFPSGLGRYLLRFDLLVGGNRALLTYPKIVKGRLQPRSFAKLSGEDVPVQILVAKLALGVVAPAQFNEFRHLLVNAPQFRRRSCEQFPPVWARVERNEFLFDDRQQFAYGRPIWFPGEVDRRAVLLVARAHP
jgi:hypothetical protein